MTVDQRREVAVEVEKPAAIHIEQIAALSTVDIERLRIPLDGYSGRTVRKNQARTGKAFLGFLPNTCDCRHIKFCHLPVHGTPIDFMRFLWAERDFSPVQWG
ncbi:hypothetical protein ACFIOY_19245 [Bradyrhizobium sp. TZ2]